MNSPTYQNLKLIFFDLDGTLLDSNTAIIEHHLYIAKLLNRPLPTKEEIANVIGRPWTTGLDILWPNEDNIKFKETYLSYDKKNEITVFPDITTLLTTLQQKYLLGIITGRHKESVYGYLDDFELLNYFSTICTGSEKVTKPNPSVFDFALNLNETTKNIKKNEILFVGDSLIDAKCALDANVNFIAVTSGSHTKQDFERLGIKNILPGVNSIKTLLSRP